MSCDACCKNLSDAVYALERILEELRAQRKVTVTPQPWTPNPWLIRDDSARPQVIW